MKDTEEIVSVEQRAHPRQKVPLEASVQASDGSHFDVVVRDLSADGVFVLMPNNQPITSDETAWNLHEDDVVILRVAADEPSPTVIPARVKRIEQRGFALLFNQPQQRLVEDLANREGNEDRGGNEENADSAAEIDAADKPSSTSSLDSATSRNKRKQLGSEVAAQAIEYLESHIDAYLEEARDKLLIGASEAGSNADQGRYFEAMALLKKHGTTIRSNFLERVNQHFDSREAITFTTDDRGGDELALVEEQAFEDWLTLSELKNQGEQRHRKLLDALYARLNRGLAAQFDDETLSCSPLALSQHFYDALLPIGFEAHIRRLLLRLFGNEVLLPLDELYEKLNQHFVKAGILPKLPKRSRPVGRSKSARKKEQPVEEEEQAIPTSEQQPDLHPGEYAAPTQSPLPEGHGPDAGYGGKVIDLREILAQLGGSEPRRHSAPPTRPISTEDLSRALAQLPELRSPDSGSLSEHLNSLLAQQSQDGEAPQLSGEQSQAVYLTEQLMHSVGEDELISSQARQWIDRLEVPLLRLLLREHSALEAPDRPAREFLNHLEQVASAASGKRGEILTDQVEQLIDELVGDDEIDEVRFADAADQLGALLQRGQRLRDTQLRRLIEACEGQYRLEKARNDVSDYLENSLAGAQVPTVLIDLLDRGYRHLLEMAQLREDPEQTEWHSRSELLEELRNRTSPGYEPQPEDSARSEQLLDDLTEALVEAGVDRTGREEIASRMSAALPGLSTSIEGEVPRQEFPVQPRTLRKPTPNEDLDPQHAMWLGRAKMLDVGSWLLYPSQDGETRPIKLAWISDDGQRFVFVNRAGQKVLEIGPDGLAEKLRSDQANVLDQPDEPLVDRSWHTMIQKMHEQIAHQATHDQLTDLLNRKEFERQIRLKLGESKLMHSVNSALQLDLDQFHIINATAGHEAGDLVLREIAQLLRQHLHEGDQLARITGDAFAVIAGRFGDEALTLAEQLRLAIANHSIEWMDQELSMTASVGVVTIDQDTRSVSDVLSALDGACQSAKDAGRDRVRSFEADRAEISRRSLVLHWVGEMEAALETDRLELYAQRIAPVRNSFGDDLEHFEVLSRLTDVDGNSISPADFVPAAEAQGRIHLLDEWVMRKAFTELSASPRYDRVERLSLNLSGKSFGRNRFLDFVRSLFEETGVDPNKICFEITETAAVSNLASCTDLLRELRALGCRFSLDDFGTGLSNFGYLKQLPVDYLKIDGSFVREITKSTPDYGMVKTIHEIGNFLGKQTIAEYVENEQILELLRDIGVDYAQGYAIAKPIPLSKMLGLDS